VICQVPFNKAIVAFALLNVELIVLAFPSAVQVPVDSRDVLLMASTVRFSLNWNL
jgi:hypothetical protein